MHLPFFFILSHIWGSQKKSIYNYLHFLIPANFVVFCNLAFIPYYSTETVIIIKTIFYYIDILLNCQISWIQKTCKIICDIVDIWALINIKELFINNFRYNVFVIFFKKVSFREIISTEQ